MARQLARKDIAAILKKPRWTSHDLVDHNAPLRSPPTIETLQKLSKLAGLDEPDPKVLESLHSQLRFVETLQNVNTEGVAPVVRMVAPHPIPLHIRGPGTESDPWNATARAHDSVAGYYVVKDDLTRGE